MMRTPLKAAVAAAAIAGAGFGGWGLTSAFAVQAEDTGGDTATEESPDGREGCHGGPALEAMAEAIGIDVEELRTALEDGQSPAEVAEANGVSRQDLVDAIAADINEHLDQAVEDGRLTEEEADERRAEAEEHASSIADGERPEGGPPGPGPRGL
jgi:hypothetical protein